MSGEPTVISTFAGCGGSSLGYKMAGYRELLAIEWDANAVATFQLNFPEVPVWQRDICGVTADEILDFLNIKAGDLDVLDGSPPCQGFSTAGKRQVNDPRNDLFRQYVRLVEGLQPRVFVMENVSGMVKGSMKGRFKEIMLQLKGTGYQVKCRLMNAMYYGVPQSRQRLIFIGTRPDMPEPSHPAPQTKPMTAGEAFADLAIPPAELEECQVRQTWQMYRVLQGHERHRHFGLVRLSLNRPSPTIVKDAGNTTTGMIHPVALRKLAVAELKRLASYPDDFALAGKYKEKWARIGNSVPPRFMQAIAAHIKDMILTP